MDYFPDNLETQSEENDFTGAVMDMERRYEGRCDVIMLADYCRMFKGET